MKRVTAAELYKVRQSLLAAEELALKGRLKKNEADKALLELEKKYGLLASDSTLDIMTGIIKEGTL